MKPLADELSTRGNWVVNYPLLVGNLPNSVGRVLILRVLNVTIEHRPLGQVHIACNAMALFYCYFSITSNFFFLSLLGCLPCWGLQVLRIKLAQLGFVL